MNKKILLSVLVSVVVGVAITLISGFIQTPMEHLGVDVVYWGVPLAWTMRVIPTRIQSVDWLNLAADLVFWVALAFIASTAVTHLGTKKRITHSVSTPSTK